MKLQSPADLSLSVSQLLALEKEESSLLLDATRNDEWNILQHCSVVQSVKNVIKTSVRGRARVEIQVLAHSILSMASANEGG